MSQDVTKKLQAWAEQNGRGVAKPERTTRYRTTMEIEEDRVRVARWYLTGKTISWISEQLNIPTHTVNADLTKIREAWAISAVMDYNAYVGVQLARIDVIEQENWEQWQASKEEYLQTRTGAEVGAAGTKQTSQITKRRGKGDTAYMTVIQWCVTERNKMLGLYAPAKIAQTTPDGMKPYDPISDETRMAMVLKAFIEKGSEGVSDPSPDDAQVITGTATAIPPV